MVTNDIILEKATQYLGQDFISAETPFDLLTITVANVPSVSNTSTLSGNKHHSKQSETTTGFVAGAPLAGSVESVIAILSLPVLI